MYRRVALTATVACGALLFIGHLKRKFRRNACAAVRVFIHQLQKVRHETLKVTWFVKRGLADADALRALLDPRVELVVVATGRLADVDAATEILVSGDAPPYDADPGGLARLARLEAFLQPYAGVPDVVAKALRRERRRRNVNDLTPLVCCNSHHNAPMTAELAVALALAAAKRLCVADERLRRGDWRTRGLPAPPPGYGGESPLPQLTLDGKRAVVAGLGAVGSRVAVALAALGARVSATSRSCSASKETTLACGAASALVTLEPAARKRVLRDLRTMRKDGPEVGLEVEDCEVLTDWVIKVVGAPKTVYEGEIYRLRVRFHADYPTQPPEIVFMRPAPKHEHIYSDGKICLNILYNDWEPTMDVKSLCLSLLSMLSSAKKKKRPPDNDSTVVMSQGQKTRNMQWEFHDDKC